MAKYGRGLNREIVGAVNQGLIKEPLTISKVRSYTVQRGWDVPESYMNSCLPDGSSNTHSQTYKKYFDASGSGMYRLKRNYVGNNWR